MLTVTQQSDGDIILTIVGIYVHLNDNLFSKFHLLHVPVEALFSKSSIFKVFFTLSSHYPTGAEAFRQMYCYYLIIRDAITQPLLR